VAANLNKVLLIGNLTRDPELRYLTTGRAVTTFSIAVNRNFTTQSGEKKEETTFVRIVTWDKRAEVCNEYLKKGSPVFVEGRLQSRTWEAQDGSKRSTTEIVANSVQFLSRGPVSKTAASEAQAEPPAPEEEMQDSGSVQSKTNEEEVPF
jgi:single-strand DNA-binding protein